MTANESGTIERECGTVDEGQSTNEVAVTEGVNTSTEVSSYHVLYIHIYHVSYDRLLV